MPDGTATLRRCSRMVNRQALIVSLQQYMRRLVGEQSRATNVADGSRADLDGQLTATSRYWRTATLRHRTGCPWRWHPCSVALRPCSRWRAGSMRSAATFWLRSKRRRARPCWAPAERSPASTSGQLMPCSCFRPSDAAPATGLFVRRLPDLDSPQSLCEIARALVGYGLVEGESAPPRKGRRSGADCA